jgi:hypothetical protein
MQVNALLLLALSVPFLIILVGMIGFKWSDLKAGGVALLAILGGVVWSARYFYYRLGNVFQYSVQ